MMHLWLFWGWKQKRQGYVPRLTRAASPHGYWTSPCQYVPTPKNRGATVARNKEIRSSYHVGHGKGDGKRLWLFGETQDTKRGLEVKGDTLAFRPPFCHKKASARTAFFPAQFRQARKRRCAHEETLARARSRGNLRTQASD